MSFPFDLHSAAVSDSHLPCHARTMPFFSRPQQSTAVERHPCCAVVLRRTAWSEHGMASVNQTRPHCVNQMGKTHSKHLLARHGRATAWERHAMCESAFSHPFRSYNTSCSLLLFLYTSHRPSSKYIIFPIFNTPNNLFSPDYSQIS